MITRSVQKISRVDNIIISSIALLRNHDDVDDDGNDGNAAVLNGSVLLQQHPEIYFQRILFSTRTFSITVIA